MLGWLVRVLLLRILPRRLVPLLTVIEAARLIHGWTRRRGASRPAAPEASPEGRASVRR